jgi:hypothetical protein
VEALICVERGAEWDQARATRFPIGTKYTVAEYDPGEYAEAVTYLARESSSDLLFLGGPDVWVNHDPDTLQYLGDLAWNADVTYGPLLHFHDGAPKWMQGKEHFCPNRLYRENYIPGVSCVKRESFLKAGGLTSGMWDLYVRMHEAGAHIKYVAEAISARDAQQLDPSPAPPRKELLATFYYQATPGTTYWRCLLPARYLPGQAIFNYPVQAQNDDGELVLPQQEGAAILQFTGDESHYLLVKFLQGQGVRVLVEVDDNYSSWFPQHMVKAGWKRTVQEVMREMPANPAEPEAGMVTVPWGYCVETHLETVKQADGVICTTPFLAKQYRKHNENVYVCGNHIDPTDWPEVEKPDDGRFRVGWFASASHRDDGRLIEPALRWLGKQRDVEIVMVGVGSNGPKKPWWNQFPYKHVPWSPDFAVYRKMIQEFDVGLAPVVGSPWALCRSDLKALEYGMGATVPFVSDVPCYEGTEMPHLQRCKTPKDFLRAVQWAHANQDEVREQGGECREWTLENRTIQDNIGQWKLALEGESDA